MWHRVLAPMAGLPASDREAKQGVAMLAAALKARPHHPPPACFSTREHADSWFCGGAGVQLPAELSGVPHLYHSFCVAWQIVGVLHRCDWAEAGRVLLESHRSKIFAACRPSVA